MVSFTALLVATAAVVGASALPAEARSPGELAERSTPNGQGTDHGYFWQFCMLRSAVFTRSPWATLTAIRQGLTARAASPTPTAPAVNTA